MRNLLWSLAMIVICTSTAAAGGLGNLPPVTPDGNAERSSIPAVYFWDLSALYPDEASWMTGVAAARAELASLAALHPRLADPATLAAYLGRYYDLELAGNRLNLYANLSQNTDTTDQAAIARQQQGLTLTADIMNEGSVLRGAVLALSADEMAAAYAAVPELERFRPAIDSLRRRADRVLDAEAERVLALAGDNLWAAIDLNELPSPVERAYQSVLSELPLPSIVDGQGNTVGLTLANYGLFRASADRRVRRDAVQGLLGSLKGFENTFAATLAGQAQLDVLFARARRYDTALEAYLDKDEVPTSVYHNLIATVRAHAPALHRYVELRKRALGLDEVHLYDLYIPMVEGVERRFTYPEGARAILESMAPLGPDYVAMARQIIDPANGAIDVYPSKRKDSGAFSSSVYGVHPYIKMNYMDRYDDVSTLTHELGHALHSQLSAANQPYLTSRYTMLLAEIASTCNEMLLSRYMLDHAASDAERAWLLSELAEAVRTTIYRQTMFAEFELKVHELAEAGEPITASRLNEIYAGIIRDYYGPGFTLDPNDGVEWAYIPHFYYKYYVYSYATGLASGISIAERIAAGEPGARDAYLGMLKAGNSRPPVELLQGAGVDLTTPQPIAAALEFFERTVAELEKLVAANE
ncbi:MAG: oligoendopeptidase F [Holophagae bacterium]|nr:MAG: oligoendopeptidase F [Holophagae bacterium]